MTRKPRERQPFIRRGAESNDIFIEDLRGIVWNSSRDHTMHWKMLAEKADVRVNTISKFAYGETKRPTFRTVFRIMEALGIQLTHSKGDS